MVKEGYLEYLMPENEAAILEYWESFLQDQNYQHPLALKPKERLNRTCPIVIYGDEGSTKTGANAFMFGTWSPASIL